jgi:conjugative transfer signal peptidase TraF
MKVLFALVVLSFFLPLMGYRVNLTPSMPVGVYQISHDPVERNHLAAFCLEDMEFTPLARRYLGTGSCLSGLRPLLKEVAGLPGDMIGFRDGLITLNGHVIAGTALLKTDSMGRPAPVSRLTPGIIPPGKALMLSHYPGSFDGRYFGLVPLASLDPVQAILTF